MEKKQFVVIGMGRFGQSVAKCLSGLGVDVLAIDMDEELVEDIAPHVTHAVQADVTDEQALEAVGLRNFDVAVVTIGDNVQASVLVTMLCREMGVQYVVAKAQSELHARVLYKTGADRVVFPERDMGVRVAHNLVAPRTLDYMEIAGDLRIVEIAAAQYWVGKSLTQLDFRRNYGVNILAIKPAEAPANLAPHGENVIQKDDTLIISGDKDSIARFERETS